MASMPGQLRLLVLLLCHYLVYCKDEKKSPEITTSFGILKGTILHSRNGREYYSFTKVPFAKPPLGPLRFKPPVSPEPWKGVLDASQHNPPCFQILFNAPVGSEDCLYLNVYTPYIKANHSLPVMIYLFGGGWRVGLPGPSSVAKFFMDEDVVIVMINYRLGALGFLSTEDETIPGNMGLKDMVAALEWTKNEISNFGGNPDLITAFGLSAGAASAHYLCTLPKTRAFLKGCISQSGVGGSHWSLRKPGVARISALLISKTLGCAPEEILSCLQSKTALEITKTESKLRFWKEEPLIIYGPVLEPKINGSLLTEWPIPDTNFPWLTGVTSHEGLFKSLGLIDLRNKSEMIDFEENRDNFLPKMLNLPQENIDSVHKIAEKFFINKDVIKGIEKLYTEGFFIYPALHELRKHQGPKYFYIFNVTGGPSLWETLLRKKVDTNSGVAHGDEHPFFFDSSFLPGRTAVIMSQPDNVRLSQQLIQLWVHFAKHQKPTPDDAPTNWLQFGSNAEYLLLSKEQFLMKKYNEMGDVLRFWNGIFENTKYENAVISDEL